MIRALLVEDEPITRKGLLKHVPWSALGIETIRSAEDAETAMQMSSDYEPDIIISDIKMREIDGIEMCRYFKERLPDCQFIFISSYAQKEYLKAAIELEAIQYVEKPIELEELTAAVKKAVQRFHSICENRSMQINYVKSMDHIKNETFFSLLRDRNVGADNEEILKLAGLWNEDCKGFRICMIRWVDIPDSPAAVSDWYTKTAGLQEQGPAVHVYADFWDNATMLLYLAAENTRINDNEQILTRIQEMTRLRESGSMHFLAIGRLFTEIKDLMNSYQSALHALQCLSYKGYGSYALYNEECREWQNDLDQDQEHLLRKAIQKRSLQDIKSIIHQIFDEFIDKQVILNSVIRNICIVIYNHIREEEKSSLTAGARKSKPRVEYTYILEQAATLKEIREMLLKYAQTVFAQEDAGQCGSNASIRQVIAYMQKHYQEKSLNINRMAEEVFLAPTYLSSLFKQETGMTINQYLTRLRMEHAKTLLTDTKLKLYQIADTVGYEDAAYFARIFKNQAGMTPQEYKEKNIL